MPLTIGSRIGPYEILSSLGAGGMGEVYRAHDTRLDRDVALKVLPGDISSDPERLKRFEQEARATAALSHPNILAVYDIGVHEGVMYVASELLEGTTLRDALEQPVPPAKACAWAVHIANGLAAAHAKHIIHRDVKPENLFLTRDGRVKILDFGLARVGTPVSSDSATMLQSPHATQPGMVMGTATYMSPEQARGHAADERSDIFSLGVVLYEMLAGQRPFTGPSVVETMNATLTADPPEFESGRMIPQPLDRIVRRCLEKRPDDRFHSAHDLALALEAAGGSRTQPIAAAPPPPKQRSTLVAGAAALGLVALSVATTMWMVGNKGRNTLPTLKRLTFRMGTIANARFEAGSDDVAYSARWQGEPLNTFTVHPDSPESAAAGQPNTILLALSPARQGAFLLSPRINTGVPSGTLALLALGGGGAREVATRIVAADFTPDGQLAATEYTGDRSRIHLPVGNIIYEAASGVVSLLRCAPKSDLIALAGQGTGLVVIDSKGTVKATLALGGPMQIESVSGLAWSPDGTEIWYSHTDGHGSSTISAVKPGGTPRDIWRGSGLVLQDIASDGTLLVVEREARAGVFVQRDGAVNATDLGWLDGSVAVDFSPDGNSLLINEQGDAGGSFYARKLDGSPAIRLGSGNAIAWSPRGDRVLALRDRSAFSLVPVGAGTTIDIPKIEPVAFFGWFRPDGRMLINGRVGKDPYRFWWMDPSGQLKPAGPEGLDHWAGERVLSHDGRLVAAFTSGKSMSGTTAIYPIDGGTATPVVGMNAGEVVIQFTNDDQQLLVYDRDTLPARIFALDYRTGRRSLWREFAPTDAAGIAGFGTIVISPDGRTVAYNYRRGLSTAYLLSGLR